MSGDVMAEHAGDVVERQREGKVSRTLVKRAAMAVIALAGLAGGGMYCWNWWTISRFRVATDDAYLQADYTSIAPKVSGYIRDVLVADNQHVKAGQALAHIDPRDFATALAQAKAEVAAGWAAVANDSAQITLQLSVVQQAKANRRADMANLRFAREDSRRYTALAVSGAGSVQDAQRADANAREVAARVQSDRSALLAARRKIAVLATDREEVMSLLKRDEAAEHQAALNLSYTTIVSPIDGTVGARSLRIGQYVEAGTDLMAIVPLHAVYVVANFKETQLTRVRPGEPAQLDVDTFPDHVLRGRVDSIAPASGLEFALLPPDNATGNFTKIVQRIPVKIVLDAGDPLSGLLRPGMSVEASVDTKGASLASQQTPQTREPSSRKVTAR